MAPLPFTAAFLGSTTVCTPVLAQTALAATHESSAEPYAESYAIQSSGQSPINGLPDVASVVSGVLLVPCLLTVVVALILRRSNRRAGAIWMRAGWLLSFAAVAVLQAMLSMRLRAAELSGSVLWTMLAIDAVLVALIVVGMIGVLRWPTPHLPPACSRCGYDLSMKPTCCSECGLAADARVPLVPPRAFALVLGGASAMMMVSACSTMLTWSSGEWSCTAKAALVGTDWVANPGTLPQVDLRADVRMVVSYPESSYSNEGPLVPLERFAAEVVPSEHALGGTATPPVLRFASRVENGTVLPPRAEYDAAVERECDAFLQALPPALVASVDSTNLRAMVLQFAALLRDRLERGAPQADVPAERGAILNLTWSIGDLRPATWRLAILVAIGVAGIVSTQFPGLWTARAKWESWVLQDPRVAAKQ